MTRPPQPLHIFRKDLLHLWPETLVAVILFVAFAWAAPSGWARSQYAVAAVLLSGFLKFFLMPISWLVVITRLVQDEPLVGDRQFWTSRPYHWARLLAAKLLYIVVFLYLPFFLMQVYLLKHAGLYPMLALPALLHNLLLLTVIVVVPLTALAAVTATFARMLLTTVGALIYLVIVSLGGLYLVFRRMPPPGLEYVLTGLFILLPAIALVYQYATRRTATSRILLAATPVVILLLLFVIPATALIQHRYTLPGSGGPQLGSLPQELLPKSTPPGLLRVQGGYVQVGLPVAVSGIDRQSNYVVKGLSVTIDAPGFHWTSPYLNDLGNDELNAYNPASLIPVMLPESVFNRVHTAAADIHLSLAADHLKASDPTTWKATLLPFSVPGHGVCSYASDDPDAPPICRYPLRAPEINLVGAQLTAGSCSDPAALKVPRRADLNGGPPTLDFDPVVSLPLTFRSPSQEPQQPLFLCPGTALEFVQAKSEGSTRLEVTLKQLILDRYATRFSEHAPQGGPAPGREAAPGFEGAPGRQN